MRSALYEGVVHHRRALPPRRAFSVRGLWLYVDLAEWDRVFRGRWLWGTDRPALAGLRRRDHLPDEPAPRLDEAVRDRVEARTGRRPAGRIGLLTMPRFAGLSFNPVSFFYVFDAGGEALEAAVAEVTNTPWRERHAYVLAPEGGRAAPTLRARVPKGLHVSPFLPMDLEHRLRVRRPGRRLALAVEDTRRGARVLCARLVARRRPLDGPALAGALARFPLQPLRVLAGIYGHALRLALAGAPFHPHPGGAPASAPPPERVR